MPLEFFTDDESNSAREEAEPAVEAEVEAEEFFTDDESNSARAAEAGMAADPVIIMLSDDDAEDAQALAQPFKCDPEHNRLLAQVAGRRLRWNLRRAMRAAQARWDKQLEALLTRDTTIQQQWARRRLRRGDLLVPIGDSLPPQKTAPPK